MQVKSEVHVKRDPIHYQFDLDPQLINHFLLYADQQTTGNLVYRQAPRAVPSMPVSTTLGPILTF